MTKDFSNAFSNSVLSILNCHTFLLAAFGFFAFFMFQSSWNRAEINEGLIYNILMFPCLLLIFYPAVFGIQNDEDSRILEILFGIPDYRYKVWGVRLLMIYVVIFDKNPFPYHRMKIIRHTEGIQQNIPK